MVKREYMLHRGDAQHGPYSAKDLIDYIAKGHIAPTDIIWKPGMTDWNRISDLYAGLVHESRITTVSSKPEPIPAPSVQRVQAAAEQVKTVALDSPKSKAQPNPVTFNRVPTFISSTLTPAAILSMVRNPSDPGKTALLELVNQPKFNSYDEARQFIFNIPWVSTEQKKEFLECEATTKRMHTYIHGETSNRLRLFSDHCKMDYLASRDLVNLT